MSITQGVQNVIGHQLGGDFALLKPELKALLKVASKGKASLYLKNLAKFFGKLEIATVFMNHALEIIRQARELCQFADCTTAVSLQSNLYGVAGCSAQFVGTADCSCNENCMHYENKRGDQAKINASNLQVQSILLGVASCSTQFKELPTAAASLKTASAMSSLMNKS